MRYTKGSIKINNDLNRIDKELNNNKNVGKNITILEDYLNQPYFKTRVKKILFKGYMQVRKVDKAYNLIKELYEITNDETALMDFVKLLLDMGEVEKAKKYVNDAYFSNEKIYLLGLIYEYEGNYEDAITTLKKLKHTLMESDMHIELGCIYEYMHDLKSAKEEFKCLLNTSKKYQAKLRLIKIAFGENDPELPNLIQSFDIDNCKHQGDIVQYKRCVKYYKYLIGDLKEKDVETYSDRQLYSYSKDRAIYHVNKRHLLKGTLYKLYDDINLNELYDYCASHLKHLIRKDDTDMYLVKMPYNVGYLMDYKTDLLEVIVIPNTNKILTMYPVAKVGMYEKMLNEGSKTKDER